MIAFQGVELRKSEIPWKCPQKRLNQLSPDADDVLFQKLQGILNKITPQNFHILSQQVFYLDINNKRRMDGAIDRIITAVSTTP